MSARDPVSGQFAYDGDFGRLCRCGHSLGVHVAGGFDCLNGNRSAGGDGGPCDCERFRPVKVNAVGDEMIKLMRDQGGGVAWSVCTLDGWMNDAAYNADVKLWNGMNPHPANRMTVASAWMRRDERFEQARIHAHDTAGRARVLRLFTLKPEFRAAHPEAKGGVS